MPVRWPEATLHRLYLIVGGTIVAILFAALVVPWFVNWNDYRPDFESQASRILGHPVHVLGWARASILPSPSVTFTNVSVGDPDKPLMTVNRFAVTVELLPLIGGQIRVVAMRLDEPVIRVAVDNGGDTDWLQRLPTPTALAPDSVALTDVSIHHGSLDYRDASSGVAFALANVNAALDSPSLFGPWKITGTWGDDSRSTFAIATGRRLDDGSIRMKVDASPADWPVAIALDGSLSVPAGTDVKYAGTYTAAYGVADAASPVRGDASPAAAASGGPAWESQGSFTLTREHAVIDKAVLSHNAADGATSVAGSLTVNFGRNASFDASVEAKQLDFDRALGGGPSQPANVGNLAATLAGLAATAPPLPVPGKVAFDLPAIVIGGAVAQDVALVATTQPDGWKIATLSATLPGQATLSASGDLSIGRQLGFTGNVDFAVAQPAVLAGWWRGTPPPVSAVALPPFAVKGEATIGVDRFAIDGASASVGTSGIAGSFSWSRDRQYRREIDADLKADRIDLDSIAALAALTGGASLADLRSVADSFQVRFAADAVALKGVTANDIAIDAAYTDDTLNVVQVVVGDIGGASLHITSGRIDGLSTASASGHLEAHVDARKFDGLARVAAAFGPANGLSAWLTGHGAALAPASVDVRIAAPARDNGGAYGVELSGKSGPTTFSALLQSDARPADLWTGVDRFSLLLDSHDSAALARQFGFDAQPSERDAGAHVALRLNGVPQKGLATTVEGSFANLTATGKGTTTFGKDMQPGFAGAVTVSADDVGPFLETVGVALPGLDGSGNVALDGTASVGPSGVTLAWKDGRVASRAVSGKATLSPLDGRWNLTGDLDVDLVDLRWVTALALGAPLAPGSDTGAPWPKTPFMVPDLGSLSARLGVTANRLALSDAVVVENARIALAATAERVDCNVLDGALAGGKLVGGLSLRNPDGNASLAAQLTLRGAAIAPFVWQAGGVPLATGTFDMTASLEAGGRSAATLVSSLTGGGTVSLHGMTLRSVNGDAIAPIIRVSDLGEQYTEDLLKVAVESQIGGGTVTVTDAGSAFSVAAGTARFDGATIDTSKVSLTGDAALDLNKLALSSDWAIKFKTAGTGLDAPGIGMSFRGPITAPERSVDVVPLSAYLSTRQAGRMIQILAIEDADRLEQERFAREILRFRGEPMRAARQQRADAAAAEAQAEAARVALERAAEVTAAARDAAVAAATAATKAANDAHARATAAADALDSASAKRDATATAEAKASSDLAAARSAFNVAAVNAADLSLATGEADKRLSDAVSALAVAQATADKVDTAVRGASDRLDAAKVRAADADNIAATAAKEAADAEAALQSAGRGASDALGRSDAARAALDAAAGALKRAAAAADEARAAVDTATQLAATANAERAHLAMDAKIAKDAASAAAVDRDVARKAVQDASAAATNAELDADRADQQGAPAFTVADKKAVVDSARQRLSTAQQRYHDADDRATDLAARVAAAAAAAEKAASVAVQRQDDVNDSAALKIAALAAVDAKTKTRDDAVAVVAAAAGAAKAAGAAFDAAQQRARQVGDSAATAAAAARDADHELAEATKAAAAVDAGSAGFDLEQATASRNAAASDADVAHAKAAAATTAAADAKAKLAAAGAAHDTAATAALAAEGVRTSAASLSADANTAASAADTAAAAAAATARQRAVEASAAAAALQSAAPAPGPKAAVPLPRQKSRGVPAAVAGQGPVPLLPLAQ